MFGLSVLNDLGSLQLSSDAQYLSEHDAGTFSFGSGTYSRTFSFAQPSTSAFPPMVFIRMETASQGETSSFIARLIGSPGNWTGFNLRSGNQSQSMTGKWFAAVYQPLPSTSDYGFRVWDENSQLIYDLNKPLVKYSRFITNWTYAGRQDIVYVYNSGVTLAADEYVMVNQFIRSHVSVSSASVSYLGITIRANSQIQLTANSSGVFTNFGYFALPIAKRSV